MLAYVHPCTYAQTSKSMSGPCQHVCATCMRMCMCMCMCMYVYVYVSVHVHVYVSVHVHVHVVVLPSFHSLGSDSADDCTAEERDTDGGSEGEPGGHEEKKEREKEELYSSISSHHVHVLRAGMYMYHCIPLHMLLRCECTMYHCTPACVLETVMSAAACMCVVSG